MGHIVNLLPAPFPPTQDIVEHYGAAYHEATWRPLMGALEAVLVDEVRAGGDVRLLP